MCQSFRNQGPGYTLSCLPGASGGILCQSFRNQGPGYTQGVGRSQLLNVLCQSFRNQGPGYTGEVGVSRRNSGCVNPSEIKDLVTLVCSQSLCSMSLRVSILQKSRTWLHSTRPTSGMHRLLCQSFRNQGPGYTCASRSPDPPPNLCQSFRNQGPGYTRVVMRQLCEGQEVSILQKSRTWLHVLVYAGESADCVVSILQKSRTWLHTPLDPAVHAQNLCQSFRNQGPGYTQFS